MSRLYYLKDEVYFEPLFNNWYAWPYLLAPVQGARYMTNTHRRLMKSFVDNYKLHVLASREPGLAGSEFLECSEDQVSEIKELIGFIDNECTGLIKLSGAVAELDELLRSHTSGESIEYLYPQIPQELKGYVELFFDLEHNLSYRLFESLIYKSEYYKPELQSVSFGLLSISKKRPFVLSTPRLADDLHIHMRLDFKSAKLEKILMSRTTPIPEIELHSMFEGIECKGGIDYRALFTTSAPKYLHEPVSKGVVAKYLGHAGFLLETPDVSIMVDPVIASRDEQTPQLMISYSELPAHIDYICLTHTHSDHVNIETLLQLRHKTKQILVPKNNGGSLADPSIKLMLRQLDFNVTEFEDLDELAIPGGKITSIPFMGEHGDLNIRSKTAWLFDLKGKKLFFGADSSNLDPHMYAHLHKFIGDVDVLAIGMECVGAPYTWMYGALHTKRVSKEIKNSRRLNGSDFEKAIQMVKTFNPSQVYIYALGMEECFKYFMGVDYDDDSKQIVESNKMNNKCVELGIDSKILNGSYRFIVG